VIDISTCRSPELRRAGAEIAGVATSQLGATVPPSGTLPCADPCWVFYGQRIRGLASSETTSAETSTRNSFGRSPL